MRFDVRGVRYNAGTVGKIAEQHGAIEILVNNAGITKDASLSRMSREMWDAVVDTNLGSCFNLCKLTFEGMPGEEIRPHRQC